MGSLRHAFWLLGLASSSCYSQGIENVIVETFHSAPAIASGEDAMTTYRIFVDLAPGYELQMVYGDEQHQFKIETSTYFHNDSLHSEKYADHFGTDSSSLRAMSRDSWLTMGTIAEGYMGIPKELDTDGSVVDCASAAKVDLLTGAKSDAPLAVLCPVDGMIAVAETKDVVNYKYEPGYMGRIKGLLLETTDGAWAVLGSTKGPTEENIILIAQIVTTGSLSFKLNLQLRDPQHQVVKYVAANAAAGEILIPDLLYGKYAVR